ncbi:carboxypeptidase-like regulatory domain-containing protein [uncultured Gimesia sp.]|uniref:carboxypeptidase-like regulatory domain-containing protein n=1 Tax=uncultured Gimesia sp. TaxID=1678688 RepID=UPI0030D9B7D6
MLFTQTCPRLQIFLSLTVLSIVVGCSSDTPDIPDTASVSGTVTYKGEPLKGASIVFSNTAVKPTAKPAANATINAITDESGQFELKSYFGARTERKGVIPGTYKVTLLKMVPPGKMTAAEYQAKVTAANQIVSGGGVLTQAQTPPELQQLLPRQYSDVTASKLEATVVADQENQFQFDLK